MRQERFAEILSLPLRSGVTVAAAKRGSGIRMVNMGELFRYRSIPDVEMARVELGDVDVDRFHLAAGDLLFARRSLTLDGAGMCTLMGEVPQPTTWESSIIRARVDPKEGDPRYYFHYFRSPQGRQKVEAMVEQVAAAGIRLSELAALRVPVPPLAAQRAVAEVLGALDDKIAANTRVAETFEALFAAHFAALQAEPDTRSVRVDELVELNPRCAPLASGDAVYLDMQKLPTTGSQIFDWGRREPKGGARFMNGDTVLARITPCLQNRKTGFVDFLEPGETALGSTEFVVLRSRPGFAKPLSFLIAVDEGFRAHAIQHMVGTSGRQRVAASDLAKYEFRLPLDRRPLVRLGELAAASFALLASQRNESRQLAALRDTLLPHLISGRISVREAEKAVEEVL